MSDGTRSAIVTGSARGIGRAIAIQLAKDGFNIALNDLPSSKIELDVVSEEIRALGRKALIVLGDVSREEDVEILVARTVEELGELYIMVANAGIVNAVQPISVIETSLDEWNRTLSVNLTGVFLCYRAAARQMIKQGKGGRILGASSVFGKRGDANAATYSASKFGVRGLTQSLAGEMGKAGITVNAYSPGWIDTPMVGPLLASIADRNIPVHENETKLQAAKAVLGSQNPMGRMGKPEDVAALVSYIVSDRASFMTGQTVSIDGGHYYS